MKSYVPKRVGLNDLWTFLELDKNRQSDIQLKEDFFTEEMNKFRKFVQYIKPESKTYVNYKEKTVTFLIAVRPLSYCIFF